MTLTPTLDPGSAATRVWDVVVIGAGPAGAMAARETARRGGSVLLVDRARFPRFKVCGCCLNPRALGVLRAAGLGDLMGRLGAVPQTRLRLAAAGRAADIPLVPGAAVSREAFDSALIRSAIAAGAAFLPETAANLLPPTGTGERRALRLRHDGRELQIEGRLVLAAGGLGSRSEDALAGPANGDVSRAWQPGSRVGAGVVLQSPGPAYQPGTIYMACARDGYVGQTVLEDGRLDVAAALDPLAVKQAGGPGPLAERILTAAGFPVPPGLAVAGWKGTPHLSRQAPRLGGHRLFILGDAAGYVEPFTGEGMAWALAGAVEAAPLAVRAARQGWTPDLLPAWQSAYHRQVTRRQGICRMTAGLLRRPLPTRVAVRVLGSAPWLARPVLHALYRH